MSCEMRMLYKKGYRYQLVERAYFATEIKPDELIKTPWITLTTTGLLILSDGYAWDGPTWAVDTQDTMRASACHDALCQLVQIGKLSPNWKQQSDLEYYKLCRHSGMWWPRARWHWLAIRLHDWTKTPDKPVLVAK